MNNKARLFILVLGSGFILFAQLMFSDPTSAAPELQLTDFPTPTPGPDGRIIYIVQPEDTLWRIAAVSQMTIDEIRQLNNISPDEVIVPGQTLLLGLGGPVEQATPPSSGNSEENDLPGSVATLGPGNGVICVLLYDDVNGDALRQDFEVAIPNGAVSITERNGLFSGTLNTEEGSEPVCFEVIPEGNYTVTVAIPEGYNATTFLNLTFDLRAGDLSILPFGAQVNGQGLMEDPVGEENPPSPLLGLGGVGLLLIGLGLGIYSFLLNKQPDEEKSN